MARVAHIPGYEHVDDYDFVGIKDMYKRFQTMFWEARPYKDTFSYRPYNYDSVFNITRREYVVIFKAFVYKLIEEMLYQGRDFYFPYNAGFLRFVRRKNYIYKTKWVNGVRVPLVDRFGNKVIHSQVDAYKSKLLKKTIYFTNEHTNGDYFTLKYYSPINPVKRPYFKHLFFHKNDQIKKFIGKVILADPSRINVFKRK